MKKRNITLTIILALVLAASPLAVKPVFAEDEVEIPVEAVSTVTEETAESNEAIAIPATEAETNAERNIIDSGSCGPNLTWTLDDAGLLKIEGTGNMTEYASGGPLWSVHLTKILSLEIGEGVTTIGSYAFKDCDLLKKVVIPNTVTSISKEAFNSCDLLEEVVLGKSVTTLGIKAFANCPKLAKLTLSDALTKVSDSSVNGSFLKTPINIVYVPSTVTSIPEELFRHSTIAQFICEESQYEGGIGYFDDDGILYKKNIYTEKQTLVKRPGGKHVTECNILEGTTEIGDYAFENSVGIKKVVVLDTITSIGKEAFNNCDLLEEVVLGKSVTTLGTKAFANCPKLAKLTLSDALTKLSDSSVNGSFLKTPINIVYVPSTVTSIPEELFRHSTIAQFICEESQYEGGIGYFDDDGILYKKNIYTEKQTLVKRPGGKHVTECNILEGTTEIGDYAFENSVGIKKVVVLDTITSIGKEAFNNCDLLEEVVLGKSVTTLGTKAFANCPKLAKLTLSDALTKLSDGGTSGSFLNTPINIVYVPSTVTSIPEELFGHSTIAQFICEESQYEGGIGYFDDDGILYKKNIYTEKQTFVKFPGGKLMKEYTILDGTTAIGVDAFRKNTTLNNVYIPATITDIGNYAFNSCTYLKGAYFYGNAPEKFGTRVFDSTAADFTIYYINGKSGWTTPTWNNYKTATWQPVMPDPVTTPTVTVFSTSAAQGESVDVTITLEDNTGITSALLRLNYDPALTLTNIQSGDALSSLDFITSNTPYSSPVTLYWYGVDDDTTNGTLVTLTFSVPAETEPGEYPVTIEYNEGDVFDTNYNDVALIVNNGAIEVAEAAPIYGDVNHDGELNGKDITAIRRYITGGFDIPNFDEIAADVNDDGIINGKDITLLRRKITGTN